MLNLTRKYLTRFNRIALLCCLFIMLTSTTLAQYKRSYTVVIDPGHGGKDPGAKGEFSLEKDVVLDVSLILGKYLEENLDSVKVIYTRTTDVYPELYKRAEIANNNDADLFISIHANANPNKKAYGTETLVLGLHRAGENFEVAVRENSVILLEEDYEERYQNFDPTSEESYIMFSLMQSVYDEQSVLFANEIQTQFEKRVRRHNRGVKRQGLLVLAQISMPGVLIELGFISNRTEEKYLNSKQGQDYLASAIFRATRDHFEKMDAYEQGEPINVNALLASSESDTEVDTTPVLDTVHSIKVPVIIEEPKVEIKENKDVVFKVQVLTTKEPIDIGDEIFYDFNDVEEFIVGNKYKYAVGSSADLNEIKAYSKMVKNRFPDAFVIAVEEGQIVPLRTVIK